jgi:RNA polymerase sigma factor (TIGR02999 family)
MMAMNRDTSVAGGDPEPSAAAGEITRLLDAARTGDAGASERLFALVYDDLRQIARRHVRAAGQRDAGHQATSLVHEAFLRLAKPDGVPFADRRHFFAVASRAMRQIVIDDLRARQAAKRGAGAVVQGFEGAEEGVAAPDGSPEEALAIDQALGELERAAPRLARVVEWHFFGGLTFAEIGEALGLTERTVLRDWRAARSLLHVRLASG